MFVKYPRTLHLPWSLGISSGDKVLQSIDTFHDKRVIVTEKMDGENTSLYRNGLHARSLDSTGHDSRNWIKAFHAKIKHLIPDGWRICGENMFAIHSIYYDNLPSYFLGFSIWDEKNCCLSWDETLEWFYKIGVAHVPVLYTGKFDVPLIKQLWNPESEGYVVRIAGSFSYDEFSTHVGKFVRANHVQAEEHWMTGPIRKNALASESTHRRFK